MCLCVCVCVSFEAGINIARTPYASRDIDYPNGNELSRVFSRLSFVSIACLLACLPGKLIIYPNLERNGFPLFFLLFFFNSEKTQFFQKETFVIVCCEKMNRVG